MDWFEYEYDSDEDLNEREAKNSHENVKEKEEKDDYEIDDGYLNSEEENKEVDEVFCTDIAKGKAREKIKRVVKKYKKEHETTQELKPRLWGVFFERVTLDTEVADSQLGNILGEFGGIMIGNNICIETGFSKTGTRFNIDQNTS